MNWIGDLLYYDNPKRRKQANQLQKDIITLNDSLRAAIDDYNAFAQVVFNISAHNAALMTLTAISRQTDEQHRATISAHFDAPQDPLWTAVADTLLQITGSIGAATVGVRVFKMLRASYRLSKALSAQWEAQAANAGTELTQLGLGSEEMATTLATTGDLAAEGTASGVEGASDIAAESSAALEALPAEVAGEVAGVEGGAAVAEAAAAESSAALSVATGGLFLIVVVGVEVVISAIQAADEREQLEEILEDLGEKKALLEDGIQKVAGKKASLQKMADIAVERYGIIFKKLMSIDPFLDPGGQTFSSDKLAAVESSQNTMLRHFTDVLQTMQKLRNLSAKPDFQSDPDKYFDMMIMLDTSGLTKQKLQQYYRVMQGMTASPRSNAHKASVTFANKTGEDLESIWVNFDGAEQHFGQISAGHSGSATSYADHVFVFRTKDAYRHMVDSYVVSTEAAQEHDIEKV